MRAACVPLFIAACGLLYFGSGILLFVPGYRGESYFSSGRVTYGVLPTITSALLLTVVGWLWSRKSGDLKRSLKRTYSLASMAVGIIWTALWVIGGLRQG